MANAKNILVGAAQLFVSQGNGSNRPDVTQIGVFPWNVVQGTNSGSATASGISTPAYLGSGGTASAYWRALGYTTNGVEISYEPGYSDVVVDQSLDAARLFQHTLKVVLKTEVSEGVLENLNLAWGQADSQLITASGVTSAVNALSSASTGITQLNIQSPSLGSAPVERTVVLVGKAPGQFGLSAQISSSTGAAGASLNYLDESRDIYKERVYVARRAVQTATSMHSLKRDAPTAFPVEFRCLPDDNANYYGSEYGFIVDRVFG